MKFKLKTGEVMEGRPIREESPACFIFNLFDEKGREFLTVYKLPKDRFSESEIDSCLEDAAAVFKGWARKKLLQQDIFIGSEEERDCTCSNGNTSGCILHSEKKE